MKYQPCPSCAQMQAANEMAGHLWEIHRIKMGWLNEDGDAIALSGERVG